jgi:hypothetical protein
VTLSRRAALRALSLSGVGAATLPLWGRSLLEVAFAHAEADAPAAADAWTPLVLSDHEDRTVVALTEAILPATDTPGAKAALVNRYIDAVLDDAEEKDQKRFQNGLAWLDDRCRELFGCDFASCRGDQQEAILTILSSEANQSPADRVGRELFATVKSLTITGYYTSEIGMREELGDDGNVFFEGFQGCTHPAHGGTALPGKPVRRG